MTEQPSSASTGRKQRIPRPEPERTGPRRDGWAKASARTRPTEANPDLERIVTDAVRVGYSVVEENLRHGRAAAERIGAGGYDRSAARSDLALLGNRLVQAARDLGSIWFDMVGALVNDPRLSDALRPRQDTSDPLAPAAPAAPPRKASSTAGTPVPLTVTLSGAPATVLVAQLEEPRAPALPKLDFLRASDAALPPLGGLRFAANGEGVEARLTVPSATPAGTYSGIIADAVTGTALGMIAIRVGG